MSFSNCQYQKGNHSKDNNRTSSPQNEFASRLFPPTVAVTNQVPEESCIETYLSAEGPNGMFYCIK